jgi:hypothetical protein
LPGSDEEEAVLPAVTLEDDELRDDGDRAADAGRGLDGFRAGG